jgi:hypothetical protein
MSSSVILDQRFVMIKEGGAGCLIPANGIMARVYGHAKEIIDCRIVYDFQCVVQSMDCKIRGSGSTKVREFSLGVEQAIVIRFFTRNYSWADLFSITYANVEVMKGRRCLYAIDPEDCWCLDGGLIIAGNPFRDHLMLRPASMTNRHPRRGVYAITNLTILGRNAIRTRE